MADEAKWIVKRDNWCYWHECSNCGNRPPKDQWGQVYYSRFCPDCGCRMVDTECAPEDLIDSRREVLKL